MVRGQVPADSGRACDGLGGSCGAAMTFLKVSYEEGEPDEYFAPLVMRDGTVQDALQDDAFCDALLGIKEPPARAGTIRGETPDGPAPQPIRRGSAGAKQLIDPLRRPVDPEGTPSAAAGAESGYRDWQVPDRGCRLRSRAGVRGSLEYVRESGTGPRGRDYSTAGAERRRRLELHAEELERY